MARAARDMTSLRFAWLPGDEEKKDAGQDGRGGKRGCSGGGLPQVTVMKGQLSTGMLELPRYHETGAKEHIPLFFRWQRLTSHHACSPPLEYC